MTGYGEAEYENEWLRISVEVKSINAKYVDVNIRLPRACSAKEIAWRNLAIAHLERGKIALSLAYERKDTALPTTSINPTLFKHYYSALQTLAEEVGASSQAIFHIFCRKVFREIFLLQYMKHFETYFWSDKCKLEKKLDKICTI